MIAEIVAQLRSLQKYVVLSPDRMGVKPVQIRIEHRIKVSAKESGYLEVHKIGEGTKEPVSLRIPVRSVQRCKTYALLTHTNLDLCETTSVITPYLV